MLPPSAHSDLKFDTGTEADMNPTLQINKQGKHTGAAEDYGAGLAHGCAGEVDELVLADHDLLYQLAPPKFHSVWSVKRACYLAACAQQEHCLIQSSGIFSYTI